MLKITIEKMAIVFCLIYASATAICNLVYLVQNKATLYIVPLELFCICLGIFLCMVKVNKRTFTILLFVAAFCLKAFVAVYYNAPQKSDFDVIYNAALKLSQGDFSFSNTNYFRLWSYQTGIVAYYALFLKLGLNIIALKLVNCLFIAGVNVLIYRIASKLVNEKCSRFISIMYLIYPATFFLCSVLTNQHISNFFILLGVYYFIYRKTQSVRNIILPSVSVALGNAMRPQGIVILAAFMVYAILEIVSKNQIKKVKINTAVNIACFLIVYLLLGKCMSLATQISGVNQNGLENDFPLYKVVVGLNEKTAGCYSNEDAVELVTIKDKKARNEKSIKMIEERLSDRKRVIALMVNKYKKMWVIMDDSIDWGFKYINDGKLEFLGRHAAYEDFKIRIQRIEKVFYCFIFFMAAIGIFAEVRKKEYTKGFIPLVLIVATNFGVYWFIEIQPRYRDFQMIFVFLLAAIGLEHTIRFIIKSMRVSYKLQ